MVNNDSKSTKEINRRSKFEKLGFDPFSFISSRVWLVRKLNMAIASWTGDFHAGVLIDHFIIVSCNQSEPAPKTQPEPLFFSTLVQVFF